MIKELMAILFLTLGFISTTCQGDSGAESPYIACGAADDCDVAVQLDYDGP